MSEFVPTPPPPVPFPHIRSDLPLLAPLAWLRAGWNDFAAHPFPSLFYGACFTLLGWVFVFALSHAVAMVTGVTTGFLLVAPFFATGLYELSLLREQGETVMLAPTLSAWRRNLPAFGIYSLVLIVIYLLWARASMVIFALFYQGGLPTLTDLIQQILRFDNTEFLIAYFIVGGIFACIAFAVSVVSIPLILDQGQDTITAMIASALTLFRNPAPVLLWAAIIVTFTAIGISTAFFGMLVLMPLLGHTTWYAYRALVEPGQPPAP
ncbi:MAG: DUF2189 domain-containing protein [Proteobacteria bacterium]|nr:DUF2189 domain-containing protein [Pseudomonadota bacterium]HQR04627.1 DUF2189 domain-containing protein [Rhodocyclaceae bacterium]